MDRDQLKHTYSAKSDDELLDLHAGPTLTETAYELLEAELQTRGLSFLPAAERKEAEYTSEQKVKGLGGWLILVGIGVVFGPIRLLVTVFPTYLAIFDDGTWEALTTVGSEAYHPLWGPFLVSEISFNLGMFAAGVCLLYLFFSKHFFFPKLYIAVVAVSIVSIPLDSWLLTSLILSEEPIFDPDTLAEFARALGGGLVWIPYMLVSRRVRATFVERIPTGGVEPPQDSPRIAS